MSAVSPKSCGKVKSGRASLSQPASFSVAPTGEVLSKITRFPFSNTAAIAFAADSIYERFGL